MDRTVLFSKLCQHYSTVPDRRGWVHIACPRCGKVGTNKNIHFSFSLTYGCKCLACGYTTNLETMARNAEIVTGEKTVFEPVKIQEPVIHHYAWMDELPEYVAQAEGHPSNLDRWMLYRGLDEKTVKRYHLGTGAFPAYSSQCNHTRLLVPVYQNGVPIALRGRAISGNGCEAAGHKKWLSTALGGRPPILFNGGVLLPPRDRGMVGQFDLADSLGPYCQGRVLIVVENPVDCLMLETAGACVVATLGVTMWTANRAWTAVLKQAHPKSVLVMYDHDLPGNGAANAHEYARMVSQWKAEHNGLEPPISNGLRLANELQAAGIPASAFRWPTSAPLKADPGWLMEQAGLENIALTLAGIV
jgi:hypothetical protein